MNRLIVGISGASGIVYAIRLLEVLREHGNIETHLVMSPAARQTTIFETDWKPREVEELATVSYRFNDIAAPISSGSFKVDAMVIVPCSVRTLGGIAMSLGDNLLIRAADVTLKERRPLLLALRETPLHIGHIKSMQAVAAMGGTLVPMMPSFYARPKTIDELVDQTVGRLLDQLHLDVANELVSRWEGPAGQNL